MASSQARYKSWWDPGDGGVLGITVERVLHAEDNCHPNDAAFLLGRRSRWQVSEFWRLICSLSPPQPIPIWTQGSSGQGREESGQRVAVEGRQVSPGDMGWGFLHRPWVFLELVLHFSSQARTFSVCGLCGCRSSLWGGCALPGDRRPWSSDGLIPIRRASVQRARLQDNQPQLIKFRQSSPT